MADDSNAAPRRGRRSSRPDGTPPPTDDAVVDMATDNAPDVRPDEAVDVASDDAAEARGDTPDARADTPEAEAGDAAASGETPVAEVAEDQREQADASVSPDDVEASDEVPAGDPAGETGEDQSTADASDADQPAAASDTADQPADADADASTVPIAADTPVGHGADDEWAAVAAGTADAMPPTSLWSTPIPVATATPDPSTSLPWLQARSLHATICPFLRAVGTDDSLGFPVEAPDAVNRCAAMREPVPQSLRQQELVCLTTAHVNCPRYLRGATLVSPVATPRVRTKAILTPAISVSLIILTLSFGASVAFGLANGGLVLPSSALATTPAAGASASAIAVAPSIAPSIVPASIAPVATASATPLPSQSLAPSPSVTPAPTPTPKPSANPAPTPKLPSPRAAQLKRCPDKPNCWIYRIHSGDNLYSIAKYFGVPLSKVKALNPWTRTTRLKAGQKLILPNPTR